LRARNIETGAVGHWCVKITTGCKNCYSSGQQKPYLTQLEFTAGNRAKVKLFLEERALAEVLRRRKPTRYFWCDMTDMFLEDYPVEWIDRCFEVMAKTPQHTHMVLTKRAERMRQYIWRLADSTPWPYPNVWLGVSAENQACADERIPLLLAAPAAVRFISAEPLLGPLDLSRYLSGIDLVIIGGESGSGPDVRRMDLDWARSLIHQCRQCRVAAFFKQAGSHYRCPHSAKGGCLECLPEDLRVRETCEPETTRTRSKRRTKRHESVHCH
jgi:protein gp37